MPSQNITGPWLKNTAGQPSMSATFAVVAFVVTTLAYVVSVFQKIGPFTFKSFDSTACGAYLIPILGLYFSRRYTDAKLGTSVLLDEGIVEPPAPDASTNKVGA